MKALKYILLGIFIISIIFSCNSQTFSSKPFREIVLQSEGTPTKDQLMTSKKIISDRLKTLQINSFEIIQNDEKSQLTIKLKDSLDLQKLAGVLTAKGEFTFDLTYGKQEVISKLTKLDPSMVLENNTNIHDVLALLSSDAKSLDTPVIGDVELKDTALVSKCLNSKSVKSHLPDGLQFVWGQNADKQGKYELFAISLQSLISGKTIKDASVSQDAHAKTGVNITFNNEGSAKWKDVTSKNLGKAIAMVIDNKVYAAPIVRSEISNGNCIITGNYTDQEARQIVSVLRNGVLPVPFIVIN